MNNNNLPIPNIEIIFKLYNSDSIFYGFFQDDLFYGNARLNINNETKILFSQWETFRIEYWIYINDLISYLST